ncbi:MAG: hypothetical protein QW587_04650 [Candidatus Bathyarchaeia archaeon]
MRSTAGLEIYHRTRPDNFIKILEEGVLKASDDTKGTSFSSCPTQTYGGSVKLIFDKERLEQVAGRKLKPVCYAPWTRDTESGRILDRVEAEAHEPPYRGSMNETFAKYGIGPISHGEEAEYFLPGDVPLNGTLKAVEFWLDWDPAGYKVSCENKLPQYIDATGWSGATISDFIDAIRKVKAAAEKAGLPFNVKSCFKLMKVPTYVGGGGWIPLNEKTLRDFERGFVPEDRIKVDPDTAFKYGCTCSPKGGPAQIHLAPSEPSLKEVLKWNETCVLGDILAMERHLVELGRTGVEDQWCLKKHRVHAIEHCLNEAINHAESLGMNADPYRKFKERFQALPEAPSLEQVRALRDEWRRIIKDPTLTCSGGLCRADLLESVLKMPEGSVAEKEEEYAERVVAHLASYLGVPKPKVVIVDSLPGPVLDVHAAPDSIILRRGMVSAEAILHEFDHYVAHVKHQDETTGRSIGELEEKARRFSKQGVNAESCEELQRLNTIHDHHLGRTSMRTVELAGIFGSQFAAKIVERLLVQADVAVGKAAAPIYEKPSFLGGILGLGLALPIGAAWAGSKGRISANTELILVSFGVHNATKLIDVAEQLTGPWFPYPSQAQPTPSFTPSIQTQIVPIGLQPQIR